MVMETRKLLIFVLMAVAVMMPNTRGEPGLTIAGGSWPRPKPKPEPEPEPEPWSSSRPLCLSQFALVNHACSVLPITPIDPPDPLELESDQHEHHNNRDDHGGRHRHQHRHHRHSHRHRHHTSPIEDDCCKWLKEVDSICVCELLVHLPPFLTMPAHAYSITVDDTCSVTFTCSQRT